MVVWLLDSAKRRLPIFLLTGIAVIYCYFLGSIITVFSPSVVASILAIPIGVLLWSAPDLKLDLSGVLFALLLIFIISEVVIPNFYAFPVSGLGWINFRKIVNLTLLSIVALSYATSFEVRMRAVERVIKNKVVMASSFGFLGMIILSVPVSGNLSASFAYLPQVFTTWYVILAAVLGLHLPKERLSIIFRCLIVSLAILALICLAERILKRRVMFDIMPSPPY